MIIYLVRAAKRFAVLIPGFIIAYFSVRTVFPWFDRRLPIAFAVFLTYVIGAYALIPALIRLLRIIRPKQHIQSYSVTPDGFASDPVNIGIVGSQQELIGAMEAAGWSVADNHSLINVVRQIWSVLFNRPYPTAPMSTLYLFGRKQDIGFEMPIEGGRGERHHVRFWATAHQPGQPYHSIEWHTHTREADRSDVLWVGSASRDTGFAFIRHNVQITHMIDPDTNAERSLIIKGIKEQGLLASTKTARLHSPYTLVNRAWFGSLHTDGLLKIVKLKRPAK